MTPEQAAEAVSAALDQWIKGHCYMIGEIVHHAFATLPDNWLACDGSQYLRADYPDLYEALHTFYHVDAENFIVPDLRGRVSAGAGAGAGLTVRNVGELVGAEAHQLTVAELASHDHAYLPPTINPDIEGPGIPDIGATVIGAITQTSSAGSNQPHNNMQPTVVLPLPAIVAKHPD